MTSVSLSLTLPHPLSLSLTFSHSPSPSLTLRHLSPPSLISPYLSLSSSLVLSLSDSFPLVLTRSYSFPLVPSRSLPLSLYLSLSFSRSLSSLSGCELKMGLEASLPKFKRFYYTDEGRTITLSGWTFCAGERIPIGPFVLNLNYPNTFFNWNATGLIVKMKRVIL